MKDAPIANEGRSSPGPSQPATETAARSGGTIHGLSREDVGIHPHGLTVKPSSGNTRPFNDTGRRPKDVNPAASFARLRISEDHDEVEGARPYTGLPTASRPDGLSLASSINPSLGFSSGSPRQAHGRVKPMNSNSNMGPARRLDDENAPLNAPITMNAADGEGNTLSARRYG